MEKMEEEIWNLIQKCHLESLFWKVIGHFDNSNSVIEILYRKEEQKYEIKKMWCKRLATIFVIFIGIIFIFILGSLPSEKQSIIENKNIISREDEGKEITFEIIAKMNGKTKSETMTLNLEDREFTEEELKKLDKMCLSYLKEKEKFASSNEYEYDKSNATITFSLHAESPSGSNVDKLFTVYVKLNEWSLILFKENGIPLDFNNDKYQSVTITIQSICLEKMKFCPEILSREEMAIYNKLLDDSSLDSGADKSKISITHGYVSYFFTKDNYIKIPDRRNTELLNCIGLRAFNDSMRVIGNISSAEGIHVSASVPDDQTMVGLSVWAEKVRNVYNKGETENLPEHITNIESLEKLFGAIESIDGSLSIEDTPENFWWKMKTRLTNMPVPSWLGV